MFTKVTYLENAATYIEAKGRLDIYNAPDYLDEVKEHLRARYTKELILEFSNITFVASIGLRIILELHKLMQGRKGILKLKNVNNEVLYSFKITGFDKFLIIENDSDNPDEELTESSDKTLNNIVKIELKDIIEGLNKWHNNIASIMGCNSSGGNIEAKLVQTLLLNDESFNETLENYEKISKNEYLNDWTNQRIPFNEEIQKLFGDLIPKLKEVRARIKSGT